MTEFEGLGWLVSVPASEHSTEDWSGPEPVLKDEGVAEAERCRQAKS
jgi:hypothetical protein